MFFTLNQTDRHVLRAPGCCSVVLLFGLTQLSESRAPCQSAPALWTPGQQGCHQSQFLNASLVNGLTFTSKYKQQLIQVKSPWRCLHCVELKAVTGWWIIHIWKLAQTQFTNQCSLPLGRGALPAWRCPISAGNREEGEGTEAKREALDVITLIIVGAGNGGY